MLACRFGEEGLKEQQQQQQGGGQYESYQYYQEVTSLHPVVAQS